MAIDRYDFTAHCLLFALHIEIDNLIRSLLAWIAISMIGSDAWPPKNMIAPIDVPKEVQTIDPWITTLLSCNVKEALQKVKVRLRCDVHALSPIVERMSEFTPCQIAFSSGVGHVRCVRRTMNNKTNRATYDTTYFAQPLDEATLKARLDYFDPTVQPMMLEFLTRFAGSGEEKLGTSGQFTFASAPTAEDFGYRDESSLDEWKNSRLFYSARNGDGVFIKPCGATAWRVLETDETIPIAETLEDFIKSYAEFRSTDEVFDSHAYQKHKKGRG